MAVTGSDQTAETVVVGAIPTSGRRLKYSGMATVVWYYMVTRRILFEHCQAVTKFIVFWRNQSVMTEAGPADRQIGIPPGGQMTMQYTKCYSVLMVFGENRGVVAWRRRARVT